MSIENEVAAIARLSGPAIVAAWERAHGAPAPNVPPSMLARAMTWQMQARAHGGLEKRVERHLDRLVEASEEALRNPKPVPDAPAAGTRFLREWGGRVHHVELLPNGRYAYAAREWRSLSVIAKHITGAHWSGPRFFGVAT